MWVLVMSVEGEGLIGRFGVKLERWAQTIVILLWVCLLVMVGFCGVMAIAQVIKMAD